MNKQLKLLAPLAILLLSGCAEMVKKNYGSNRGGTVRYTTGWFLDEKNRSKAIEEMRAYCNPGRAQLLSESSQSEFTGHSYSNSNVSSNHVNTSTTQSKENYVYLNFRCVKGKSQARR